MTKDKDKSEPIESGLLKLAKMVPDAEWEKVFCRCCGGRLARIRGRYPKTPDRSVCPTCVVERLEDMVSSLQSAQCAQVQPQGERKS